MSFADENTEDQRSRRYENEDTTPTSDRELKGWYFYGLAAEVYAVCGVGMSGPISSHLHLLLNFF